MRDEGHPEGAVLQYSRVDRLPTQLVIPLRDLEEVDPGYGIYIPARCGLSKGERRPALMGVRLRYRLGCRGSIPSFEEEAH